MPKKTIDFSKTVIYKIQHKEIDDLLYVGSTTKFTQRKWSHKGRCNNVDGKCYNFKLYKMIRDNGGWDMFNMVIIKPFPCQNFNEARTEEDNVIRTLKANLNSKRAYVSPEERQDYIKRYCEENRDKRNEYKRQYYKLNSEKIGIYHKERYKNNKEYFISYAEENEEHLKEYRKEYYKKNIEKIKENHKSLFQCPCGGKYTGNHKSRHFKSIKHQDFLKNNP